MPAIASLAACLAIATTHYGVSASRIEAAMRSTAQTPTKQGVGVMGIPAQWMPYLSKYGFNVVSVSTDPCENVIAGAWIIAYTQKLAEDEKRWAGHSQSLPQRALPWQPTIQWIALRAGVSVPLVNALIEQESSFNPNALGPRTKGGERAIGLMQLMPSTARAMGLNAHDPVQNLWGGTWYLANLIRAYRGDSALALAAYNAGPGAVARYGGIPPFRETENYVPTVLNRYLRYSVAMQAK